MEEYIWFSIFSLIYSLNKNIIINNFISGIIKKLCYIAKMNFNIYLFKFSSLTKIVRR